MAAESILSMIPTGLFGRAPTAEGSTGGSSFLSLFAIVEEGGRKRPRESEEFDCVSCGRAPTRVLLGNRLRSANDDTAERPSKRLRGERTPGISSSKQKVDVQQQSEFLRLIPEDVVAHCLSYLGRVEDRFSLQCTCTQFRRISNSDEMLANVRVGGDEDTGMNGIIQEHDTPESAAEALTPFAQAGNLEAMYMLGMIKSYCHRDVQKGIDLLKQASLQGFVRSSYALGLVLRDSQPDDAAEYMKLAATEGYLPALQELLPAREMKAKFGEPNADELRRHLDPLCLNRLLGRYYVQSAGLRDLNTSHCWNPLCGRWAFKAMNTTGITVRVRRPWGFAVFREADGSQIVGRVNIPLRHRPASVGLTDGSRISDPEPFFRPPSNNETNDPSDRPPPNEPRNQPSLDVSSEFRVSRMKMCSRCCRAKYCSKLCQVYDWRSGRHKMECQFL